MDKEALSTKADTADRKNDFDIMDAMEMGLAREFSADFVRPLCQSSKLWKFHVKRSDDRQHYRLYSHDGEFLMYAFLSKDGRHIDFHLYDPLQKQNSLYDPNRPAFTMSSSCSKTEWRLVKEHDDNCNPAYRPSRCGCQKQELCCIHQSRQTIGDGTSNCMEVVIPLDDDASVYGGEQMVQRLVTKMPVWNDEVESLVLDFKGRQVQASAKNFQLVLEDNPKYLACQYCKISANTFSLDFRHPMSVIHAFSTSLATLFWT